MRVPVALARWRRRWRRGHRWVRRGRAPGSTGRPPGRDAKGEARWRRVFGWDTGAPGASRAFPRSLPEMRWRGWVVLCAAGKGRTGTAGVGRRSAWAVEATRGNCWWCCYTGGHQGIISLLYGRTRSLETKPFLCENREGQVVLTRVMPPINKAHAAPRGVMAAHIKQHGETVQAMC